VARHRDRLSQRAEQAGMTVVVSGDGLGDGLVARADAAAVEHILFNLVDNACKYAGSAEDRRIELDARGDGGFVYVMVRDHGPGIAPADRGRIFRAFSKSARDAAHSAPGVGLGLSLCRRLARGMGGELFLDGEVRDGALFVLKLRAA